MAFQFSDAQQFAQDYNRQAASTRDARVTNRILNDANSALHGVGLFDFDRRSVYFPLFAQYTTGTVSATVDSATLTGVGTTFTSAMVGRLIRLNGEYNQYYIATYVSSTSITIQPTIGSTLGYIGSAALSAVTFAITYDRIALPSDYNAVAWAQVDNVPTELNGGFNRDQLAMSRKLMREVSFPRCYATDTDDPLTGSSQANYLWVYPPCDSKRVIQVFYYAVPTEASAASDEFGVGNKRMPFDAEQVLRMYICAFLDKEQKQPDWQASMDTAEKAAEELLANRTNLTPGQRKMWTVEGDTAGGSGFVVPFGSVLSPTTPGYQ